MKRIIGYFSLLLFLFFINTDIFSENKTYFMNISEILKLHEFPEESSKVILSLNGFNILELIETGNKTNINGKDGRWLKVKTKNEIPGWCFNDCLKEMYFHEDVCGYRVFFPSDWYYYSFKEENRSIAKEDGNNYFHIYNYNIKLHEPYNILKLEAGISNNKYKSFEDWQEKAVKEQSGVSGKEVKILSKKILLKENDKEIIKVSFKNAGKNYPSTYFYRNGTKTAVFYVFPENTIYIKQVETIISNFEY
jgi:hypothetical protein